MVPFPLNQGTHSKVRLSEVGKTPDYPGNQPENSAVVSLEMFEKLFTGDIPDKYELPDTRYSDVFTLVQHSRVGPGRSGDDVPVQIQSRPLQLQDSVSHSLILV